MNTNIRKSDVDLVNETAEELLKLLSINLNCLTSANLEGIKVDLKGRDSAIMIGYRGENLRSFSYILVLVIRRKLDKKINIFVDVDGYFDKKTKRVHTIVKESISRVKETGAAEEVLGLTSFERRIAHTLIASEGFFSNSIGEGEGRVLQIMPAADGE